MAANPKINSDDFFRFNAPFRQWLFTYKDKQISEFSADEAKRIFADEFVQQWNASKLPEKYYIQGPAMKTDFSKPAFKAKEGSSSFGFSKQEQEKLFTHKVPKDESRDFNIKKTSNNFTSRTTDRSFLKRREADLEEVCPKKEGQAKIVEDRRIKSAYTRFERSQDVEISDEALFTGSTSSSLSSKRRSTDISDDYNALLRLDREHKARREREILERRKEKEDALKEKMNKYNQREAEVQEMFRKMINKNSK